jgi:hypothetical protein
MRKFVRRLCPALFVLGGLSAAEPLKVGTEVHLFADDYLVARMEGMRRRVIPLVKHPSNPILRADHPWEGRNVLPSAVLYDESEKLFKMWYQNQDAPQGHAYATSRDGISWEKSPLGLVEFQGNRNNNMFPIPATVAWDGVWKDEREPDPSRRYKLLASENLDSERWGIFAFFSPDGLRWTPVSGNPVLTGVGDTLSLFGRDPNAGGRFVAYVRPRVLAPPPPEAGGRTERFWTSPIRTISRSTSEDFTSWTPMVPVLAPDDEDPPNTQHYVMSVFLDRGIYFGFLSVYHPNTLLMDVQLAVSRDGIHFERTGSRHPILSYGLPHEFDSHLLSPLRPLIVGDELRVYYRAKNSNHALLSVRETYPMIGRLLPRKEQPWLARREGFGGLAVGRRDRLVSLDASESEGYVMTKTFLLEGRRLIVNADASHGRLRAELLDAAGAVLPGFSAIESVPLTADSAGHVLRWQGSSEVSAWKGRAVRIRFLVQNARLFAVRVEN